jgi:hypothetical protein
LSALRLTALLCAVLVQVVSEVGDALSDVPIVGDVVAPFSDGLNEFLVGPVSDFNDTLQEFKSDTLDKACDLVAKADTYVGKAQEAVNILSNE